MGFYKFYRKTAIATAFITLFVTGLPLRASMHERGLPTRVLDIRLIQLAVEGYSFKHEAITEDGTSVNSAKIHFNDDGSFYATGVHWPEFGIYSTTNGQLCFTSKGLFNGCYYVYSNSPFGLIVLVKELNGKVTTKLTLVKIFGE